MNVNHIFRKIDVPTVLIFGTLAMLASSCSNEDYLGGHVTENGRGTQISIQASITSDLKPNATILPYERIGVSTGYEDNTSLNRAYICNDDGKSFTNETGYPLYVKAATNLFAYYPFQGVEGADPELILSTTDQSNIKDLFVVQSDNIIPGENRDIKLPMIYAYAQILMNIKVPEGESLSEYRLSGLYHEGSINAFSHDITLEKATSDISGPISGNQLVLTLIPQSISRSNGAKIVFLGERRSYDMRLDSLNIKPDTRITADVDLSNGIGTIEFTSGNGQWIDSGIENKVESSDSNS